MSSGSAFYAIYLLISFPLFARLDERRSHSCQEAVLEALGAWAAVQTSLDVVGRLLGFFFEPGALDAWSPASYCLTCHGPQDLRGLTAQTTKHEPRLPSANFAYLCIYFILFHISS